MAIIGSVADMRNLLSSAELLNELIEVIKDPKKMKAAVLELENAEVSIAKKKEIDKKAKEADEKFLAVVEAEKAVDIKLAKQEKVAAEQSQTKRVLAQQATELTLVADAQALIKKENEKESLRIANAKEAVDKRAEEIAAITSNYEAVVKERDELKSKLTALTTTFAKIG